MAELPYTIIVDGSTGAFQERRLGKYTAGDPLAASLEEVSPPTITNGRCQVELRRPLAGTSPFHFSFSLAAATLNIVAAIGSLPSFGPHAARDAGEMSLVPM